MELIRESLIKCGGKLIWFYRKTRLDILFKATQKVGQSEHELV